MRRGETVRAGFYLPTALCRKSSIKTEPAENRRATRLPRM